MSATASKKHFLIVCRQPPYGSSLAREALDVALATAAFDQPVAMLFLGDGVLQLLQPQDAAGIGQKSHDKQLSALPLYDIDALYVDSQSLRERGLDAAELAVPAQPLSDEQIAALYASHNVVLGF